MRVLIACEVSGVVRDAFLEAGYDAWSCDLDPSDAPGPHLIGNALRWAYDGTWDLMIAHPPCRFLSNSGVWCLRGQSKKVYARWEEMYLAVSFFKMLLDAPIPRICLENPVLHGDAMRFIRQKYTQTIQPYNFGEDASKRTCLWLKGLPKLRNTKYFPPKIIDGRKVWGNQTPSGQNKLGPSPERAKMRAKTYKGIAEAFADQFKPFPTTLF